MLGVCVGVFVGLGVPDCVLDGEVVTLAVMVVLDVRVWDTDCVWLAVWVTDPEPERLRVCVMLAVNVTLRVCVMLAEDDWLGLAVTLGVRVVLEVCVLLADPVPLGVCVAVELGDCD